MGRKTKTINNKLHSDELYTQWSKWINELKTNFFLCFFFVRSSVFVAIHECHRYVFFWSILFTSDKINVDSHCDRPNKTFNIFKLFLLSFIIQSKYLKIHVVRFVFSSNDHGNRKSVDDGREKKSDKRESWHKSGWRRRWLKIFSQNQNEIWQNQYF